MIEIPITKLTGHAGARPPAALVRSIQDQGFLPAFPIVVAQEENGLYQILDGRRRTAAALKAGLERVLAVITEANAALTIQAHSTRSENPVAELKAYQALMQAGLSEAQIARAGYASLNRVRKIARLAPEVQLELACEEKITGAVVREYRAKARPEAVLTAPEVEMIFQLSPPATVEDVLATLSAEILQAILADLPEDEGFVSWRGKIRQALARSKSAPFQVESLVALTIKRAATHPTRQTSKISGQ